MPKFFISSTSVDLVDYRAATVHALQMLGQDVVDMANFTATDANAVDKCMREVDGSDVYLGIFAWRYGFIPTAVDEAGNPVNPEGLSITEMEYKRAIAGGKRILIFMLSDDAPWPRPHIDKGDALDRIENLREFFKNKYVVGFFTTPDDLAKLVSPAAVPIIRELEEKAAAQAAPVLAGPSAPPPPPRPTIVKPPMPFVGREVELANWTNLLMAPETRLLTIVGPGGMGKSRIATEIGYNVQDRFADGACFVSLEPAKNGDEMVSLIAEKLKLTLSPQPTVREQVIEFHRDRELLIVIDNLESVPLSESGEVIKGLLGAGNGVKCLITSQIRSNLGSERVVELDSMGEADGRQFFRDRARACQESFELTAQNTRHVDEICRILEGVPLAIELAASLVTYKGTREILANVKDILMVQVADSGTKPRRQLALRAAIEYSFQKLSEKAQALLPQLAIFNGGFTAEAVAAVCGADAAMTPLGELRNHSLLRRMTVAGTDIVRLAMLESIRQFSAEKLTDAAGVARRHAEYYADFFTSHAAKLRTAEEAEALPEMEAEFGNARAALNWSSEGDAEICSRLALALQQALYYRGRWDEAVTVIETGLAAAKSLGEEAAETCALLEFKLASMLHDYGRLPEALARAGSALQTLQTIGDPIGRASVLNLIGLIQSDGGDLDASEQSLREAQSLWPIKAHAERGKSLNNLARVAMKKGDIADARGLYNECLREKGLAGDQRGKAIALGNLGALEQGEGNLDEAERLILESLAIRRDLQDPHGIAVVLNNLGEIEAARGDDRRALTLFVHAERLLTELGSSDASMASEAIAAIKERMGTSAYYTLRQTVETESWEDLLD